MIRSCLLAAGLLLGLATAAPAQVYPPVAAPFGDKVSQRIPNYNRAAPQVGTSGPLDRDGLIEAKGVGFETVLDVTPTGPTTETAEIASQHILLNYVHIPVPIGELPTREQIADFARTVESAEYQPVLVTGASVDQVGTVWALYRAAAGWPPEIAVEAGWTVGLDESTPAVRQHLGLPADTMAGSQ